LGKSSDGEVGSGTSSNVEGSGGSSARNGGGHGGEWNSSVLPSDVELFIGQIVSGIDVEDSRG